MTATQLFVSIGALSALVSLNAEVLREQRILLEEGWNAVHLEVTPEEAGPAAVFAGLPVEIAARYFRIDGGAQFIQSPDELDWKSEEWGVWYAPHREDAFLTSLHAIQGGSCYLIHSKQRVEWRVTGRAVFSPNLWRKGSFNLVGFGVDPASPPTFEDCLAGAGDNIGDSIYRLAGGRWVKVLDPTSATVRPGEAFWAWCEGNTNYGGPLEIELPGAGAVDFGSTTEAREIRWKKHLPGPLSVTVVASTDGGVPLPLNRVERDLETLTNRHAPLGAMVLTTQAGGGKLLLQLRREEMVAAAQSCLLKFTDSSGAVVWVPVVATKPAE